MRYYNLNTVTANKYILFKSHKVDKSNETAGQTFPQEQKCLLTQRHSAADKVSWICSDNFKNSQRLFFKLHKHL